MQYWTSDDQARPLGPGHKEMYVVLFVSSKSLESELLMARFAKLPLPRHLPRVVVDVEGASETSRWFGITQTPSLTVISDGALLSVEHQCEEGVCGQLIDFAKQQRSCLDVERYAAVATGH